MRASNVRPIEADLNDMEARLVSARVQCDQCGARFTPMRARMLEVLLQHNRFMTAYEILDRMRETHPRATAATVYRILGFLMEKGMAHRLATVNGYVACNRVAGNGYRIFAICRRCDTVAELEASGVQDMLASQVARVGCTLDERVVEVRVICQNCVYLVPG